MNIYPGTKKTACNKPEAQAKALNIDIFECPSLALQACEPGQETPIPAP